MVNQSNSASRMVFVKAVRRYRPARIVIMGPPGSGKTFVALNMMRGLVGPEGRIALYDTDGDAAELYGDITDFDVVQSWNHRPQNVTEFIREAARRGYDGFVIDNLSDCWTGTGGELDQVDELAKAKYKGNAQPAWKDMAVYRREMLDESKHCGMHCIVNLRTTTEYGTVEKNGKMVSQKVGVKPIQKEGLDAEYDAVLSVTMYHELYVDKSRYYGVLRDDDLVRVHPRELGENILKWLKSGAEPLKARPNAPVRGADEDESHERREFQSAQQQRREPEHRRSEHQTQQSQPAKTQSKTATTPADSIEAAVKAWGDAAPPAAAWLERMWTQALGWARQDLSADAVAVLRELYAGRTKGLAPDHIIGGAAIRKVRTLASWRAAVSNPMDRTGDWLAALMEFSVPGEPAAIERAVGTLTGARAEGYAAELSGLPAEERASYVREVLRSGWPDDSSRGGRA